MEYFIADFNGLFLCFPFDFLTPVLQLFQQKSLVEYDPLWEEIIKNFIKDMPVEIEVRVGEIKVPYKDIAQLKVGHKIVYKDILTSNALGLYINNVPIGKGKLVHIDSFSKGVMIDWILDHKSATGSNVVEFKPREKK